MSSYLPKRGDIVWINYDPRLGHEQSGKRPAVVLSNTKYNDLTGLMINCPITSKPKGYRTEVPLSPALKTKGVILSDHIRTLDWTVRSVHSSGERVSEDTLNAIMERLILLCSD